MAEDTSNNRLVLDYTSRDFDSTRSLLIGLARGTFPEWLTVGEANDFGTVLLEMVAYTSDIMNFYIDRVASEAFLGTAIRRQSVLWIADMLGYQHIGQQAASVVLTASVPGSAAMPFTIPTGTQLRASKYPLVNFETDYDVTIAPGQSAVVAASEGTSFAGTFGTSKGAPNSDFVLADLGIVFQTVTVQTNEAGRIIDWVRLDSVLSAAPNQSAFATYVDDSGYTHIIFGDNSAGRIPPTGLELRATYRFGVGASANALPPGAVDTLGISAPSGFTITSIDKPLGGADPETIDSMRFSIPRTASSQNRAVTLNDFQSLSLQVPGVAKATAYGQVYSAVTVRIAPVGGAAGLDSAALAQLRDAVSYQLSLQSVLGATVFIEDVYQNSNQGWDDAVIDMDVYVLAGYSRPQTLSAVSSALKNLFAFDNVGFGTRISIGDVYRTATNITGVDYIQLNSLYSTESGATGTITNIVPTGRKIPRLRPQIDDGSIISTEYGLLLTAFGGINS